MRALRTEAAVGKGTSGLGFHVHLVSGAVDFAFTAFLSDLVSWAKGSFAVIRHEREISSAVR